jgi:hypothetical protein
MESLAEELTLSDLNEKIAAIKVYVDNVKRHSHEMKAFLPIFNNAASLPISRTKYDGTVAYIDWILRSDELYLCLNIAYYSTGKFKCAQTLSQSLVITELHDRRNIRTLDGRRFKQYYTYDSADLVYAVAPDRIISPKAFAIIENGLEIFRSRDKILKRFDVQSPLFGV